jgi:hypothetical protein
MKIRYGTILAIIFLLGLTLQACGAAPTASPASLPPATATQPAPIVAVVTEAPTNTSEPTEAPVPTQTPEPTKIQHVTKPTDPTYIIEQTTIDCTLGRTYVSDLPVVIPPACDNPALSFIERPVVADTINYLPYLDIGTAQFGGNKDWLYARINIYDTPKPTGSGDLYYFFKLDLNLDGRNSNVILISVKNLPADNVTWTVTGVQAWSDVDGTITTIFDAGVGSDPDMVWARRSPKAIELAFKPALLNGPTRFAWTAWDYQGDMTPTDLAFSSSSAAEQYQIDNTCAWGYNVSAFGLTNHCIRQ